MQPDRLSPVAHLDLNFPDTPPKLAEARRQYLSGQISRVAFEQVAGEEQPLSPRRGAYEEGSMYLSGPLAKTLRNFPSPRAPYAEQAGRTQRHRE